MGHLADLILALHAAYVSFVVVGLALIWLGVWRGWRWVRHFWFRLLHLGAIGLVAAEALIGLACPLTVLEDWLRSEGHAADGFVARWTHRILFWDFPGWVFSLVYLVFTLLAVLTWWRWPPRRATGLSLGHPEAQKKRAGCPARRMVHNAGRLKRRH
jgi:polyferredoxin